MTLLLKFVELVAEFFDAVVLVYFYPLFLVERHPLFAIAVIYPNAPVAVDDAVERNTVFAPVPRLAQNSGDALRGHSSAAGRACYRAVGANTPRGNGEGERDDPLAECFRRGFMRRMFALSKKRHEKILPYASKPLRKIRGAHFTAGLGFEPRYSPPEGEVLPLDDPAIYFLLQSLTVCPRPCGGSPWRRLPLDDPAIFTHQTFPSTLPYLYLFCKTFRLYVPNHTQYMPHSKSV